MKQFLGQARESFISEEYRYAFAEDFLNVAIATQIKVLREQRETTQVGLAVAMGTSQPAISRLEDINYSSWSVATLKKLARALGVRLRVSFETFGSLVPEYEGFSRESLQRAKFEDDPAFSLGPSVPQECSTAEVVTAAGMDRRGTSGVIYASQTPRHSAALLRNDHIPPGRVTVADTAETQGGLWPSTG